VSELAQALTHAGRVAEGLAVVEAEIEQFEVRRLTAELLRLKGELLLLQGALAVEETAEDPFRQGLDRAHRQEALSWELRAATAAPACCAASPARGPNRLPEAGV
jgi:hypothetical protein